MSLHGNVFYNTLGSLSPEMYHNALRDPIYHTGNRYRTRRCHSVYVSGMVLFYFMLMNNVPVIAKILI